MHNAEAEDSEGRFGGGGRSWLCEPRTDKIRVPAKVSSRGGLALEPTTGDGEPDK